MPPPPQPTNNPSTPPTVLNALTEAIKGLTEACKGLLAEQTALAKEFNNLTVKFDLARSAFRSAVTGITESLKTFTTGIEFLKPIVLRISETIRNTFTAIADKITPILGTIEMLITKAFGAIGDVLKPIIGGVVITIANTFRQLVATGGAVAAGFVKLTGALFDGVKASAQFAGALAGVLRSMADGGVNILAGAVRTLDAGINMVNHSVSRFVALARPDVIFQFQYAVDSLYATIGSALVPVLQQITHIIKSIGGAIAGTSDQGRRLLSALAAGAVGLVTFGAALAVFQTLVTGGLGPLLGAVAGSIGGVLFATGKLQPIFDMLAGTMSGMMDQMGGALDAIAGAFESVLPLLAEFMQEGAGFVSYMVDAFQRAIPSIMAFVGVVLEIMKPLMMLNNLFNSILIEGLLLVGKAFQAVAPVIMLVAQVIGDMVKTVMGWVQQLLSLIGIEIDTDFGKRAPSGGVGTSQQPTRQAGYSDSMADLRKAQVAAFTLGSGSGDPPKDTARNTSQIANQVGELKAIIGNMSGWLSNALPHLLVVEGPQAVANFLKAVVGNVGDRGVETPVGKITVEDVVTRANPITSVVEGAKFINRQLDIY